MKNKLISNNGITIISLVITIIILIILAGITFSILLGEDGLIHKTITAKEETIVSKEKEVISLAYSGILTDRFGLLNATPLTASVLKEKIENINGQDTVIVTKNDDDSFNILYKETNNNYDLKDGQLSENNNINNKKGIKSVKDFGAVGDGVTDDTEAFNAAMQSTEEAIYIPRGTYIVSAQVEVKNAKLIFGDGQNSVVKLKGDTPSNKNYGVNEAEIHIFDILNVENVTLKNFKLDANKSEYTNYQQQYRAGTNFTVPLYILRSNNTTIENMYICNGIIEGIYVGISDNVTIKDTVAYGNGYSQDDASGLHFDSCDNVIVDNYTAYENGFYGLLLTATTNAKVNNCKLNRNGFAGLYVQYNSQFNYLNDIECKQNQWGVFIKAGCAYNVLNNFDISNNTEAEMVVTSSFANLLNNSTISNTSHHGIEFRKNIDKDSSYAYVSTLKGYNVTINAIQNGAIYKEPECSTAVAEFSSNLPNFTNTWINLETGEETTNAGVLTTDYIPVTFYSNTILTNNENKTMIVNAYDKDKNFLWEEAEYTGTGEFLSGNAETEYIRVVIIDNPSENINFTFRIE